MYSVTFAPPTSSEAYAAKVCLSNFLTYTPPQFPAADFWAERGVCCKQENRILRVEHFSATAHAEMGYSVLQILFLHIPNSVCIWEL